MGFIYLVRHGQTALNKEEVFHGTTDVPLDSIGRKQAAAIGQYFKKCRLKKPLIVTSPLSRARETGQISTAALSIRKLIIDPAFNDIYFGLWQGRSKDDIASQYPILFQQWLDEPEKVTFPEGENLSEVAQRAETALYRLAQKTSEHDLIIVSHRVVNKMLLSPIVGVGLGAFWKIKQDTACINILEYKSSLFIHNIINETSHLNQFKPDSE